MSRTDKDRPWQIRAADRTVIDDGSYFHHFESAHIREGGCGDICGWTLPHCTLRHPSHDDVHVVWYGPERSREHRRLRQMAKEWNANYSLDARINARGDATNIISDSGVEEEK